MREHATYFDEIIATEAEIESTPYYRFFVKQNNSVLRHSLDMTTEDVTHMEFMHYHVLENITDYTDNNGGESRWCPTSNIS